MKAAIICFSNLERDPRVQRQITALKDRYSLLTIGLTSPEVEGVDFIPVQVPRKGFKKLILAMLLLLRCYRAAYWWIYTPALKALRDLSFEDTSLIISNDIDTLPVALRIKGKNTKVLFDAHEFSPRQFEDRWLWRLFFQRYASFLCQYYMPQADKTVTVTNALAREYESYCNLTSVGTITNACPFYPEISPSTVSDNRIRLFHHGAAIPSRRLEAMVDMFDYLDPRFTLDFMLLPTYPSYLASLKQYAHNKPINFLEPVAFNEIVNHANDYDIGIFLLHDNSNFNYYNCLPNKLFEFIQARLAIAIGPSPAMREYVNQYQLGIVSPTFDPRDLAKKLNGLTQPDIQEYKQRAHNAASQVSAEAESKELLRIIDTMKPLSI